MTGKLVSLRGSEPKAGSSSHLFIDKVTGRLWSVSKKLEIGMEDSFVQEAYLRGNWYDKDKNYGHANNLVISIKRSATQFGNLRIFVKRGSSANAKLWMYCSHINVDGPRDMGVYAVDKNAWTENTITWNNQPSLGSLIYTRTVISSGWKDFNVNTEKSVCIKFKSEFSAYGSPTIYWVQFRSKDDTDPDWGPAYHPYFEEI